MISVSSPKGCHFGIKAQPYPTTYRLQCWEAPGQTAIRIGTRPHSSADRVLEAILNSQPPMNTPLDTALPTRWTRPRSTHQWAGTQSLPPGSLNEPRNQPYPPDGRYQKQEELQHSSQQKGEHKHRKSDEMRWQRNMLQMKEQHKNPQ